MQPVRHSVYPHLFSPYAIKGVTLRNRVAVSAHFAGWWVDDGLPSESFAAYLEERAKGGIGLFVIGATSPEPGSGWMENVSDATLWQVLAEANLADFVRSLPQQLDTPLGESGTRLSGGQRQRLAIARALVRNPRIILLDEATSALDTESERLVQEALVRLTKGRTTLIVAHRFSTIRHAHRIVVLQAGKIVEVGTQQELMTRNGHFARLANLQSFQAAG